MNDTGVDKPTILVTDASRGSAISIIRSLGREGWRVIAADSDPKSLGFLSRYVVGRAVYPAPERSPQEFVASLLSVSIANAVDLIVPVTDAAILPLSEARERFEGVCRLALPEKNALLVTLNKLKTIELAESVGVPVPLTCLVHSTREAVEHGPMLGWPVVLKPLASRIYRGQSGIEAFTVSYANNLDDLEKQMQRFDGRCPVLLQEYYPGSGQGVELLLNQGEPLAAFQHRRLREIPINGGASAFRESVPLDPLLFEHATHLMQALDWTGLAMVEFKVGKDGPKLMEINGRVWGSLPLAVRSGMNFPVRMAKLFLYGPPGNGYGTAMDYRVGVRARNLELDVLWLLTVLRGKRRYPFLPMPARRQAACALLDLFNPAYQFDILSLEDLRPGLAEIRKILRKLSQKLREAEA